LSHAIVMMTHNQNHHHILYKLINWIQQKKSNKLKLQRIVDLDLNKNNCQQFLFYIHNAKKQKAPKYQL